ncbi:DUF924 family protein [Acuticoccus sp. MNP-M23]|uniref:DUF924 family protein n=1 Tax=Acuticoccus sp. MNP-M23 TaxID=3072793 RepID=UPI002815E6D1|nr:DUF924 family protein [Acuticoccus sp. MNP-M23]WMS44250.1 DUF924 family protein [Acuticoccus sp. MNP-M23]
MTNIENSDALRLLDFWLGAGPDRWYARSDEFDGLCAAWIPQWEEAASGALDGWSATAAGSLALIILLDQIPRNVFRGSARQFETDAKAVAAAEAAVAAGHDKTQRLPVRLFYYLPFEHAEDEALQEKALDLIRPLKNQDAYYWALVHADAVRRFGRFPHRNAVLGRETTAAERAYLESGGFGA